MEVNFYDACYYIVKRWRGVICVAALCGLFLCGAKYYVDMKESNDDKVINNSLSEAEIQQAQNFIELQEDYIVATDYINTSIKMTINPYDKCFVAKEFVLENPDLTDMEINNLVQIFVNHLTSIECARNVGQQLKLDDKIVHELIEVKTLQDSGVVAVSIMGKSESFCQEVFELWDKEINRCVTEIADLGYEFDLKLVDTNKGREVDTNLYASQSTMRAQVNAMGAMVSSEFQKLTVNQKDYIAEINGTQSSVKGEKNIQPSLKVAVLGLVIGAFLSVLWHGLSFFMCKKVRNQEEAESISGMKCVGAFRLAETKKFLGIIDEVIFKLFYGKVEEETEIQKLGEIFTWYRDKKGVDKVSILASENVSGEIVEKVEEALCNQDIKALVYQGDLSLKDKYKIEEEKNILLITQCYKDGQKELSERKNFIKDYDLNGLGVICIR